MLKGEATGVAGPHKQRWIGKPLASRSVATYAQHAKSAFSVSGPRCWAVCRIIDTKGVSLRRGDVLLVKYRGEGGTDESGAAAAAVEESQELNQAVIGQRVEEDEGLLIHVPVVFELGKHCTFGHSFAVVGDAPELGEWDTDKSAPMQWSDGDVWRASVLLPVGTPISFKYIELGDDGRLVAWGSDVAAGGNMTVTVSRSDELISGYQVTTQPALQTDPDAVAAAAADPSPSAQPYLTARLDVAALLPMSASFFKEKQLAVSAGLPAAVAEDLMTDRVLAEQGLLSEAALEAKWSVEEMSALRGQYAEAAIAESLEAPTAAAAAAAGAAVALDTSISQLAGMSTSMDYVSETTVEESADLLAATGSEIIMAAVDVEEYPTAATAAVIDLDADDDIIAANFVEPPLATAQDADDDIIAATESDVIISAPDEDDISSPPATPSATAAATKPVHDDTTAGAATHTTTSSEGSTLPCDTKLVSAGPSADTVDLSTPLAELDSKAVVEVTADGVEPVDPIHVQEGLAVHTSSSSRSTGTEVDKGAFVDRQQLGGSPSIIPDVVTPSGLAHELSGLGSHEALLVGPEQAQALGVSQGEGLVNTDNISSTSSLDENALAAAVAAAAAAAATVRYAGQTAAVDQVELEMGDGQVPPDAAAAAAAAAVRYAAQRAAADVDEAGAKDGNTAEETQAAAAAASTRYAGQAAAAQAKEAAVDADKAARAVDERSALLHGPGSTPSVAQIMSESAVVGRAAGADAEVAGVQQVAEQLRGAAQEEPAAADQQQHSQPQKKSGSWWRWILGKKDEE